MSVDTQLELLEKRPDGTSEVEVGVSSGGNESPIMFKMSGRKKFRVITIKSLHLVFFVFLFVVSFFVRYYLDRHLTEFYPLNAATTKSNSTNSTNSSLLFESANEMMSPYLTNNATHLIPF
jgi:preprotein translocase subunit SecG